MRWGRHCRYTKATLQEFETYKHVTMHGTIENCWLSLIEQTALTLLSTDGIQPLAQF